MDTLVFMSDKASYEAEALTRVLRRMIWIKDLNVDDPDYYDVIKYYSASFTPTAIGAAYHYVRDTHNEYRKELVTHSLLESVSSIIKGLHTAIVNRSCEEWSGSDVRRLTCFFVTRPDDWDTAIQTVMERRVNDYDTLMSLLPHLTDKSNSTALQTGVL